MFIKRRKTAKLARKHLICHRSTKRPEGGEGGGPKVVVCVVPHLERNLYKVLLAVRPDEVVVGQDTPGDIPAHGVQ